MAEGDLVQGVVGVPDLKRLFIPAPWFGGVDANTWRPLSTSTFVNVWVALHDMYPRSGMEVRVLWSTSNTTVANTATWRVRRKSVTVNTDAVTAAYAVLDTVIAADSPVATANALLRTEAGVIAPGQLVAGQSEYHAFEVGLTAVSGLTLGDTDNVQFFGLELRYSPHSLV